MLLFAVLRRSLSYGADPGRSLGLSLSVVLLPIDGLDPTGRRSLRPDV
ncbi:hypothetical protein ACWEK5_29475 [Rhodococcus koreensis]